MRRGDTAHLLSVIATRYGRYIGSGAGRAPYISKESEVSERLYNVLFLCTGNSARSILAEALLNHWGQGRFLAYSAGSDPSGQVNPYALATLQEMHIPAGQPRSKSWSEFSTSDGQSRDMDLIITVCDNAAGEACPVWPGHPVSAHWGMPDPAAVRGSDAQKRRAFREAFQTLQLRVRALTQLPFADLDPRELQRRINQLRELAEQPA